jgi:ABC-type antimicrobial peptide transport system permease subunit
MTVVGVAKNDVRSDWSAPPEDEVFVPFLQEAAYLKAPEAHHASMTLVVRTRCMSGDAFDPSANAAPLLTAIRTIDRNVPISQVQTMMSVVQRATAESQFYLVLLAAFAAIAVTLAAVGIYGVMSYGVSRRTNEIGIRIALGATPGAVLGSIVRQGLSLALAGAMVGLVAALALTRLMGQLLYGVSPTDPLTFAAVVALLCGVAVMATLAPARRATHIDPQAALRAD